MTKYRITIEEIHEDGTVTPFADVNGNARSIPEHEGFVLLCYTDHGETGEGTVAIQNMKAIDIASMLSKNNTLRSVCKLVSLHDTLHAIAGDASEEGEDASS